MLLVEIQQLRIQLETLFTRLNTIPHSFTVACFVLNLYKTFKLPVTTPQIDSPVTIAEDPKFRHLFEWTFIEIWKVISPKWLFFSD